MLEQVEAPAVQPTGEVHPVAELFPMLDDEELQELADGIREYGLLEPLVYDAEGVLIDGRNRLAACRIAGVEPTFAILNGEDPVAFILEKNVKRRHLSVGQRAIVTAQALQNLHITKIPRGVKGETADAAGIPAANLTQAFTVLQFAPELIPGIMAGTGFLHSAYTKALQRKQERKSDKERIEREAAELTRLQRDAPDLAALVTEWSMSLSDALAGLAAREQEARDRNRHDTMFFGNHAAQLWTLLHPDPTAFVGRWVDGVAETLKVERLAHLRTGDGLRLLAADLEVCAAAVDARGGLD